MAQTLRPPSEPLVVVFGATGTGKSDLAVDLATRFDGEIINADAMQMYKGLPIITNKISLEEQRGIPHHLFDSIGLEEEPWFVGHFQHEASRTIREIRSRGKLPIVVGGTHYYTTGLLFEDRLVQEGPSCPALGEPDENTGGEHPMLEASPEEMLAKLREVDPVMAEKWHPRDARKIRRSLEIFYRTGRPASEIYAEQESKREAKRSTDDVLPSPWDALLFWVHTDREILVERLDRRVDKMLQKGLLDEVQSLRNYAQDQAASGSHIEHSKGIWQSIGFSQFEPYLAALAKTPDAPELDSLRKKGVEDTQTATRRYAQSQIKWISKKLIPPLREADQFESLYLLDSSNVERFQEDVLNVAAGLTKQFLAGEQLPPAQDLSETARRILASAVERGDRKETPCKRTCEICDTTVVTEEAWDRHIRGSAHKRVIKRRKRTALVPVGQPEEPWPAAEAPGVELPP
ncbi:tRNA isopentenyltransferase [Thozetella sp. PMI_491]|nr:tRNA isopentenyltransferase [Thozetella sp. PMI_491]